MTLPIAITLFTIAAWVCFYIHCHITSKSILLDSSFERNVIVGFMFVIISTMLSLLTVATWIAYSISIRVGV